MSPLLSIKPHRIWRKSLNCFANAIHSILSFLYFPQMKCLLEEIIFFFNKRSPMSYRKWERAGQSSQPCRPIKKKTLKSRDVCWRIFFTEFWTFVQVKISKEPLCNSVQSHSSRTLYQTRPPPTLAEQVFLLVFLSSLWLGQTELPLNQASLLPHTPLHTAFPFISSIRERQKRNALCGIN